MSGIYNRAGTGGFVKMKTTVHMDSRPYFTARRIAVIALLGAISVVMSTTPLGYIPLGIIQVTLMHIPVIIAAIIEGPLAGVIVGLMFGVSSIIHGLSTPLGPVFINPLVSVFPRIMIGLVAAYVYKALNRISLKGGASSEENKGKLKSFVGKAGRICAIPIAAAAGTATNTVGVLGMIYLVAAPQFTHINGITMENLGTVLIGVAATNGVAEIIAAVIIITAVVKGISKIRR